MPSIMATIGLNANPMRAELAAVQKLAAQAGVNMQSSLEGGHHSGKSGIIRESLVLMREMSAGNFTKVPGSLSILLQQIGILKYILKDASQAENVVADAMRRQAAEAVNVAIASGQEAAAAKVAALAAIEKAEASKVAAMADSMAKAQAATAASALGLEGEAYVFATATATAKAEASGAAYVADLAAADAALMNATANKAEAAAASEAATALTTKAVAASESASKAAGATISGLGMIAIGLVAVGVAAYGAYKFYSYLVDKLSDLKFSDSNPEYIPKHLKAANQTAEAQKEINREILKSVDHYNSAAQAAARVATATKEHFAHLRKLNEYEQDPRKKQVREYDISKAERQQELGNKMAERVNLEIESKAKQRQADAIKVASKEQDANLLAKQKKDAEEAKKFLDETPMREKGNNETLRGKIDSMTDQKEEENRAEAHRRIAAYHSTIDDVAARDVERKRKDELEKQARESMSKAATTALEINSQKGINAQKDKDQLAELRAEIQAKKEPRGELSINEHQKIGAYVSLNSSNLQNQMLKAAELSEVHLREIKTLLNKPKMTESGVQY